ncbi:PREDICTED: cyclin-G1 [Propithecus coquereli]|uniref:Cyclin G1 n=1 Tax=Propithecus coquereli TaxID=379532 RepID=A0A2K6F9M3_PROCO|nr:PREDICTED: cyclin-G1 [Propithecus coquereli]
MIEVLTTTDSQNLLHQLNALLEQESRCQPKVCGLRLIESAHDNGLRMTARLRDFEVKDLLSLTQFFGFDTETFSLAVNLLDRFLSKMKINGRDLTFWQELVSKCLTEYSSNKCSKPNVQKLKWIVSGRTARQLKHSYYRISHLPTIPEMVP